MTVLIKGGDREGLLLVRPIAAPEQPVEAQLADARAEEIRIAELEAALADAQGSLAMLRRQHAAEIDEARSDAHAEGLSEGLRQNKALLDMLVQAAKRGEAAIVGGLQESSGVALAIARSALGRLFADRSQWSAMIADIVAVRREDIDSHLLLGIRVSAKDFPSDETLAGIGAACTRTTFVVDPDLPSGELLFELRLGEMEAGPAIQGRNLLAFLDRQLAGEDRS